MASTIKLLRNVGGAGTPPPAAAGSEGMLALHFPGAAGTGQGVVLYGHDGTAWRTVPAGVSSGLTAPTTPANGDAWVDTSVTPPLMRIYNGTKWQSVGSVPQTGTTAPPTPTQGEIWIDTTGGVGNALVKVFDGTTFQTVNAAVTTQPMPLGTTGAGPGDGYTAAGTPAITGTIVIGTWGTPSGAYLLTTPTAPAANGSWTSLGGATAFATTAEVLAGTATNAAIDPAGLQSRLAVTPDATPSNDARKLVQLNAQGIIDNGFIHLNFAHFIGTVDITAAPAANWTTGDYAIVAADTLQAAQDAGWALGQDATAGDMIIYDGAAFSLISASPGVQNAVLRAGANPVAADTSITWTAPAADGTVILDGGDPVKSAIDNVTLDAGTY